MLECSGNVAKELVLKTCLASLSERRERKTLLQRKTTRLRAGIETKPPFFYEPVASFKGRRGLCGMRNCVDRGLQNCECSYAYHAARAAEQVGSSPVVVLTLDARKFFAYYGTT